MRGSYFQFIKPDGRPASDKSPAVEAAVENVNKARKAKEGKNESPKKR